MLAVGFFYFVLFCLDVKNNYFPTFLTSPWQKRQATIWQLAVTLDRGWGGGGEGTILGHLMLFECIGICVSNLARAAEVRGFSCLPTGTLRKCI